MNEQIRILYIEDNADNREIMQILLGDMLGYRNLVLFDNTSDIMTRLHKYPERFDVIFLDIDIKPDDGYTVCQMLRQDTDYREAVIISVTASTKPQELKKMKELGFNGIIPKPLSYDTFPQLFQRILADGDIW